MRITILITIALLLAACGSGGNKHSGHNDGPPAPPPVTYLDYTCSDVPGHTTSAAYRPTVVKKGSDGSWIIEFERDHTLRYFIPPLPASSWSWVMSRWNVDSDDVVDCIVTNTTGDGQPDIKAQWQLMMVAPMVGG